MTRSVEIPDAAVQEAAQVYWETEGNRAVCMRAALVAARPYLTPTREAITDEEVDDFCREAWPKFSEWDQRTQTVFRRTARRALELPLPVLPTREAIEQRIRRVYIDGGANVAVAQEAAADIATEMLALLNGES